MDTIVHRQEIAYDWFAVDFFVGAFVHTMLFRVLTFASAGLSCFDNLQSVIIPGIVCRRGRVVVHNYSLVLSLDVYYSVWYLCAIICPKRWHKLSTWANNNRPWEHKKWLWLEAPKRLKSSYAALLSLSLIALVSLSYCVFYRNLLFSYSATQPQVWNKLSVSVTPVMPSPSCCRHCSSTFVR